jgi:hypothetical protein
MGEWMPPEEVSFDAFTALLGLRDDAYLEHKSTLTQEIAYNFALVSLQA